MKKENIQPIDDLIEDEEYDWDADYEEDSDYPCDNCGDSVFCDGWEAQYCCTLCRWYDDDPDCDNCDPMDI